jgi:hypothetical protein
MTMFGQCTCHYRHTSPDGCTEWTCPYHGKENREVSQRVRECCPIHRKDDEDARGTVGQDHPTG